MSCLNTWLFNIFNLVLLGFILFNLIDGASYNRNYIENPSKWDLKLHRTKDQELVLNGKLRVQLLQNLLKDVNSQNYAGYKNDASLKNNANSRIDALDGSNASQKTTKSPDYHKRRRSHKDLVYGANSITNFNRNKTKLRSRKRRKRASISNKDKLWTHGVIPYEIDGNYSGSYKSLFKQAMRHWENYTCINFVERNAEEHPNYILFVEKACGCCSYVGMKGTGVQVISIGKNCDKFGNVVHELGHVVGFWHEHTRPDRDQYIKVNTENIMTGQEYNFDIMKANEIDSLKTKYDYTSVMHYSTKTFSKNHYLETITVPDDLPQEIVQQIGQRNRLSQMDILQTNLLYKCPVCGRTFQGNSANFSSKSFVDVKDPVEEQICEWRIQGTHGERIVLNVTELDIPESVNCSSDYLEVFDGYWQTSKVIFRICGNSSVNESIVSTGSRLLIRYVSKNPVGHRGFAASYEAVCGGELFVDSEGNLESPNYPMEYRENKRCIWKLKVPEGFQVALKFQAFHVESHDKCFYDYVEVRDGLNTDSPVLGQFCGQNLPPNVRSTSNSMLIKFSTDATVGYSGFSAIFLKEYDECKHIEHGCAHDCINTLGSFKCSCKIGYELNADGKNCDISCGGILETTNGTFSSPSYPEPYPANKQCIWEVRAPTGSLITMNFTHFDVDEFDYMNEECNKDRMEIYSKTDKEKLEHHGTYCGSVGPKSITSLSNVLRVVFISDKQLETTGFAAFYYTYIDKCAILNNGCNHYCNNNRGNYSCSCRTGFVLHEDGKQCVAKCIHELQGPAGVIKSPNYPDNYDGSLNCGYHYITQPGHRIRVRFIDFELDDHQECMYDYIQFHNGDSIKSLTLTPRYCGSKFPQVVQTFGNEMFMIFESTYGGKKGFQASYSTICGGRLKATEEKKVLYSHALYGQANYDNNIHCIWQIEPPSDSNIRITFKDLDLEHGIRCDYDYIELIDDLDYSEMSIGKFCGTTLPDVVESNEGAIKMVFHTDSDSSAKGFLITYQAVEPLYITSEEEN